MAQRRAIDVGRGVFLVRYVAAEDVTLPPVVKVSAEPRSDTTVDFFLHPDHGEPVLLRPGTCLVLRATTPTQVAIEVTPSQQNGSESATVNVEPLTQGEAAISFGPQSEVGAWPQVTSDLVDSALAQLRILAHIAGIGDAYANANEWLAGPKAPSRIEGISLEWAAKPRGVDITYSVRTAQASPTSGRRVALGDFAGTRGRAMALTGVMLELSGQEASRYQFAVEALFLGSPITRVTGQRVVVSGPTGREPLVGLLVSLEEIVRDAYTPNQQRAEKPRQTRSEVTSTPVAAATTSESAGRSPPGPSGRVRVFRSRPKQGQPSG
jgi:hypothetical protein